MILRALVVLSIAAVFLAVPPPHRAWGLDCRNVLTGCIDNSTTGSGGSGSGQDGSGSPGTGQGGGDNSSGDYNSNSGGDGGEITPGSGQTPEDIFKDPIISNPVATNSSLAKAAEHNPSYDSCAGLCGKPQGNSPAILPSGTQPNTEPVAANGEFVVEDTDVTLPFHDVPFVFTRTYRSGVSAQTALGYGWNHSYAQHLIEGKETVAGGAHGCKTDHPDVFYVDAHLSRILFTFDSVKGSIVTYKPQQAGVSLRLTKDPSNPDQPWTLDDGSGILLHFASNRWGDLVSVTSLTGHGWNIVWKHPDRESKLYGSDYRITWEDPLGYVDHVTDSSDHRTVWFVNRFASLTVHEPAYQGDNKVTIAYEFLQCLSLEENKCTAPLVSFTPGEPLIGHYSYDDAGGNYRAQGYPVFLAFDLERVTDANGNGPTYTYDPGRADDGVIDGTYPTYRLSKNLLEYCSSMFFDQQSDCRNLDLCAVSRATHIHDTCYHIFVANELEYGHLPKDAYDEPWFYDCMYHKWTSGNPGDDYVKARGECLCLNPSYLNGQYPDESCENPWKVSCVTDRMDRAERNDPLVGNPSNDCRQDLFGECIANKDAKDANGKQAYAFGYLSDLRHNLLTITDGDGHPVVTNTYETNPFSPNFDKVITHVQGAGKPDATNTMTMKYYDLAAEEWPSGVRSSYENSHPFQEVQVCPESSNPGAHQSPAYVVETNDINGAKRTDTFDASWNRLREVQEDGKQVDYNYQDGFLIGARDATGQSVCYERDDFGRPTLVTESPSPRYGSANPVITQISYDDAGQVIEAVRRGGEDVTGTHVIRDSYERPLAVGRAVGPAQTDWTCYSYSDSDRPTALAAKLETPAAPSVVSVVASKLETPVAPSIATVVASKLEMPEASSKNSVNHPGKEVVPSAVITPDGAVLHSQPGPSGPQDVIVDANGTDKYETYLKYDEKTGLLTQTGRGPASQPLAGGSREAIFDPAGQLVTTGGQDPNTGAWVETKLSYDHSGHLLKQVGPEWERDIDVDELGHTKRIQEKAGGVVRSTAFTYDIHGLLHDVTLPEGNKIHYDYDAAGRPVKVTRDGETVASYDYDDRGLLQSSTVNGQTLVPTYDGFGRVIAIGPEKVGGANVVASKLVETTYHPGVDVVPSAVHPALTAKQFSRVLPFERSGCAVGVGGAP